MADYIPLSRPLQSQVSINPTPQNILSDGFNFPTFRLLNKLYRAKLSDSWTPDISVSFKLLAVANHKGWFAALRITNGSQFELILSPLEDLRSASIAATSDDSVLFSPKRLVPLPAKPNIITFAESDSRLIVAFEQGSIAVYDAALLCSPGAGDVQPICNNQVQNSPFRQILPNPGSEPGLSDLVAVVGDAKVHLWNTRLESQGGWAASDLMSQPIAAAWSPKGKHIAIGLQTGDILTFALTNKSTPNKHIPPTADALLASLNWLGPGHTFRTTYGATTDQPKQHIIILDTKTSTATYFEPDHPYVSQDRNQQNAYILSLPKWDDDPSSPGAEVSLTIVGDISSPDMEVLGNVGTKWFRHNQESPLALPLNKEADENYTLGLECDLTDTAGGMPVMFAYMNDGTVAGWQLEGTKPYAGVGGAGGVAATTTNNATAKDADMGAEQTSSSAPTTSAFGTPSFGQTSSPAVAPAASTASSAFGQPSFGQSSGFGAFAGSTPSGFGGAAAAVGAKPATAGGFGAFSGGGFSGFGGAPASSTSGGFGGNGSAFGANNTTTTSTGAFGSNNNNNTTNAFGGGNNTTSAFGSTGFTNSNPTSAFGATGFGGAANNAFGSQTSAFGGTPSAFGASPSNTTTTGGFGQSPPANNTFGGFGSNTGTSNVFGQPSFGSPSSPGVAQSSSSNTLAVPAAPASMTREASMSDDSGSITTGGFGGLGLGSATPNSTNATNSMFGTFGAPAATTTESSGSVFGNTSSSGGGGGGAGGFMKPATAFGAGALGQNSPFSLNKPSTTTTTTGATTTTTTTGGAVSAFAPVNSSAGAGFGQSGFASPAFGKTSFGQPSTLGAGGVPAQPAFGATGFGTTGFGAKTGGFGAFGGSGGGGGGGGANTAFKPASATTAPASGGFGAFANAGTSGFTKAVAAPGFGAFGKKEEEGGKKEAEEQTKKEGGMVMMKKEEEETKKPFTSVFGTPTSSAASSFENMDRESSVFRKPSERFAPSPPDSPTPTPATIPSAFGGSGGASTTTTTTKQDPTSPPSSPPHSPPSVFGKSTSSPAAPPPAAPGFSSSTTSSPATAPSTPATHAFSNLQVSPSPFKLPSGFGAFGNTTPTTSPFSAKKTDETTSKVTAFGGFGAGASASPGASGFGSPSASGFGTTGSGFGSTGFGFGMGGGGGGGTGGATFGSTSALGGTKVVTKTAFGTAVAYSAFPLITPSAEDGAKDGATGAKAPVTPETPTKAPVSGGFGAFSGGASPFGQLKKEQKTSFAELLKTGGEERRDGKGDVKQDVKEEEEEDQTVKVKAKVKEDEGGKTDVEDSDDEQRKKGKALAETKDDRSYASVLASSVGSSFVDVSRTEGGSDEDGEGEERSTTYSDEEEPPEEEYEEETYSDEEEDYEEGATYDEDYNGEEDDGPEEEEEDDDDRRHKSRTPASIPLPSSRSPSATPQPEVPSVEVSPSPREGSTTPPGTPARDKSPLGGSATPGAGGIGLGRPSTRPVRSSPLANNIVSADEHKDEETSPSSNKRPRTPPLLSSFNISAPTPVTPGAPPILKPSPSLGSDSTAKSGAPPAPPFSLTFGKPPGDAGASIFGKPALAPTAKSEPGKPVSAFGGPVFGQPAGGSKSAPTFGGIGLGAPPPATSTSPPAVSPFGSLPPFSLKPGSTPPSLFGAPAAATSPPPVSASAPPFATTAPAGGLFAGPPPAIPNFGKPAPPPPMFGKPPPPPPVPGMAAGPTPPVFGGFTKPTAIPTLPAFGGPGASFKGPGQGLASNAGAPTTAAPAPMKSLMSTPPPPPLESVQGEELGGMQKECADLVDSIEKDLQDLRRIGEVTLQKCAMLKVSKPPQTRGDVTAPEKWNFSSLTQFGDALKEFQDDLEFLEGQRSKLKASLKELQNNLLKAGTRKEEIARFNKAQNDPEFAKMLKARTLGPEHSETQTQLRKSIRILRDRIHKLESHLQDSKKKLAASISGKPTFKAPSIDTINRTYRNIDSLIQQQTAEVNDLVSRVSKIDVNDLPSSPRKSVGNSDSRKGYQVSPNVAITTAAALNAERSAHKLKKALLAVRKEPLLNKKVESAPAAPTAFNTPQKPVPAQGAFAFQTPLQGSLFGDPASATATDPFPEFTLPTDEDTFSPGTLSTSSGRRGAGGQRKHQSVPLKRTPGAPAAPAAASFDWGPLPTFNTPKPGGGLFVPITSPGSPSTPKNLK